MMNRPSNSTTASSSSSSDPFVPPMVMSFVGLEPNTNQKNQLWDWEPTNPNPNTSHPPLLPHSLIHTHTPFLFQSPPFLEYPPPLLPLNSSPFFPHPFVKQEDAPAGGIGLNLGHRTYFSSGDALAVDRLFARSRGLYAPPRCQAEGCGVDLSAAKHYYRRHKVCEFHSKAAVVVAAGLHQRFCQQCSRFHVLAEFDEVKRSCRKRLADHNRRRRKPQDAKNSTTITNSLGKSKLNPKSTKDTSTTSTKSTTSISNTSVSLEKQEEYQNKASHYSSEDTNLLQLGQAMLEVDFM